MAILLDDLCKMLMIKARVSSKAQLHTRQVLENCTDSTLLLEKMACSQVSYQPVRTLTLWSLYLLNFILLFFFFFLICFKYSALPSIGVMLLWLGTQLRFIFNFFSYSIYLGDLGSVMWSLWLLFGICCCCPHQGEPRVVCIGSRVYKKERGAVSSQDKSQVNIGA